MSQARWSNPAIAIDLAGDNRRDLMPVSASQRLHDCGFAEARS